MAAKSIKLDLDLNTKDAQRQVKDLNKELSNSEDSFEDVESAGKQMARAISQASAATIDEIEKTKRAVDALETALDGFDADPQQVVGDLKKMGLTADEITADANELAAAIRSIDDVKISARDAGFDDLNKVMGETESTGRASSAAIGGIGGSISELPGIGSLGPIAESIGQLAEGALEGEVNTKQLVGALGVMGGTAAAMWVVNKAMTQIADNKAFKKQQIQDFRDAREEIEGMEGDLSAFNEVLKDSDELLANVGDGPLGFMKGQENILDDIIESGVAYDDFIKGMEEGGPAYDFVVAKMEAFVASKKAERDALRKGTPEWGKAQKAYKNAEDALNGLDDVQKNYAESGATYAETEAWKAESTIKSAEAMEEAAEAAEELRTAYGEAAEGIRDMADASGEMASEAFSTVWGQQAEAVFGYATAIEDTDEALAGLTESIDENGVSVLLNIEATESLAQAIGNEMSVALQDADGDFDAVRTTAEKYRTELRDQLIQAGATEEEIQQYISTLGLTPEQVETTIKLAGEELALMKLGILQGMLDGLPEDVQTDVMIDVLAGDWQGAVDTIQAGIDSKGLTATVQVKAGPIPKVNYGSNGWITGFSSGKSHEGGMVVKGGVDSFAGLKDDEVPRILQEGEAILTKGQQGAVSDAIAGAPGRAVTYNVYQNFPAGTRPSDVIAAQRKWEKRNGPA